jgi:hypothetical protein
MGRDPLQLARILHPEDSKERSNAAGSHEGFSALGNAGAGLSSLTWQLIELPDLFLERHQPKYRVGEL